MRNKNLNRTILVLTILVLLITAIPVNAAPSVPAEVSNIITNNCARCHVDLPSSHTDRTPGGQDSDQCSVCHVPYGNTDVYEHTATTTGCTKCHSKVETTHFSLRDDNDQTKLADNAEEECISCHRNNKDKGFTTGPLSKGKGFPCRQMKKLS